MRVALVKEFLKEFEEMRAAQVEELKYIESTKVEEYIESKELIEKYSLIRRKILGKYWPSNTLKIEEDISTLALFSLGEDEYSSNILSFLQSENDSNYILTGFREISTREYLLLSIKTKPNNSVSNNEPWGGIIAFIEIDKQLFACFLTVQKDIDPGGESEFILYNYEYIVNDTIRDEKGCYVFETFAAYVKKSWTLLPVTALNEKFSEEELNQDINALYFFAFRALNDYFSTLNVNSLGTDFTVCFFPETNEYKTIDLFQSKIYYNKFYCS